MIKINLKKNERNIYQALTMYKWNKSLPWCKGGRFSSSQYPFSMNEHIYEFIHIYAICLIGSNTDMEVQYMFGRITDLSKLIQR